MSERRIYEQLVQELRALQLESGTVFRIEQDPGGLIAGVLSIRRSSTTAPIVIEVERDDLVSLTIGEAAHLELCGKPADLKADVIDWVRAVLRGSFTETILWRDDKVARSELRIVVAGSEQKVRYYSGITSLLQLGRLRKEARRYEAYS
jgi:hypothetical protein